MSKRRQQNHLAQSQGTTEYNLSHLLLGRQGYHMWLIVKQLPMKADCWDAPLVLQVLAVSHLPQFISFYKSQPTPPARNLVIPLPYCFYTLILW